MNAVEFYELVEGNETLEPVATIRDENNFHVWIKCSTNGLVTDVDVRNLGDITPEVMTSVLSGGREPNALHYMTRVVGYFSRIDNWNKSKLGELDDRRAGNYALPAQQ